MVAHTTAHRRLAGMKTFLLLAPHTGSIRLLKFLSLWIFAFHKRHFKIVMKFNIPLPLATDKGRRAFPNQIYYACSIQYCQNMWTCQPCSQHFNLKNMLVSVKDGARCDVSIGVGMFSQDPSPAYRDHRRPLLQISALNETSRSFTVPGEGPS